MAEAGAPNSSAGIDGGSSGGPSCAAGHISCDDGCINPKLDPRHCGDCDTVCEAGEVCAAGRCDIECTAGSTQCGDRCVDIDSDSANCGGCDRACSIGEACVSGACRLTCAGGTARCGNECVDLGLDPDNCGACGTACAEGELCSAGVCGTSCANSIQCGKACVDLLTDSANCGGCGKACPSSQTCVNGSCGMHCELSSQTQCGAACVDLSHDSNHCGDCNTSCAADKQCTAGVCECSNGKSACQGTCVDTKSSAANCGACGAACATNEACTASLCDCKPGTTRCGGVCLDTSISALNCGACGSACPAGKVCTAGACAAPSSDWPTFQYDVSHSGQNGVETGKPPLTPSWSRSLSTGALNPAALGGGRLFVTAPGYFATSAPIYALNVSDGSDLWNYNFGAVSSVGLPSYFSGTVYLANGKPITGSALLWSIDAASGVAHWTAPLDAQWETYWPPLRVGDVVYSNAGQYGGLYGINAADGSQQFFVSLDQYDEWSPAYFGGKLYTFIAGRFRTHDPLTGAVTNTVTVNWNWTGYSMDTAPVFSSSLGYVIAPPNLYAIDPVSQTVAWTANGAYSGTPAVTADSVYGISAGNLIVRDAATGALKWTFAGDGALSYPPVVANGYVYVASNDNLYAVDTTSHAPVDHQTRGGWLTLGSGRLIVAGRDGTLSAYLLSK